MYITRYTYTCIDGHIYIYTYIFAPMVIFTFIVMCTFACLFTIVFVFIYLHYVLTDLRASIPCLPPNSEQGPGGLSQLVALRLHCDANKPEGGREERRGCV